MRHVGRIGFAEIGHHFVGDQGLRARTGGAAGIADGVEDNLSGTLDGLHFGRAGASDSPSLVHRCTIGRRSAQTLERPEV
jgi:hypothetical protein